MPELEETLALAEKVRAMIKSFVSAVKEDEVTAKIANIEEQSMADPAFWTKKESKALLREQSKYKKYIDDWRRLNALMEECDVLTELLDEGEDVTAELEAQVNELLRQADAFELKLILSGDHDASGAIVTVHSGAGGTEANDWAAMLLRMYMRYAEKEGFSFELMDYFAGDEAGIKYATFSVSGEYCYGYLKGETGIHRLVRISPFDSQSRRHTSFASVFVLPEIDDDFEVEISEADLRIDTYRAGGAGGQHVNTTDSAVRITHIPTNIVVTSQTDRSQHKNKAAAMKILRARLYEHEMQIRNSEKDKLEATKSDIGWGNQIRSYVMQPYKMVKDLRTRHETGNVDAVMDGELEPFIRSYLLHTAGIDGE